jgi:LPS-assembly lipoprotein
MIRAPAFRLIGLALGLLPLAACGFAPVYGTAAERENAGPINIAEITCSTGNCRSGHFLRQELIRTIGSGVPGINGSAQLEVKLSNFIERLAFTPDQAASRSDYVGQAVWTLRAPDGTVMQTGTANERASFNFADSAYADIAAQSAAQERLATLLARSIREKMVMQAGDPPIGKTTTPATAGAATPPPPLVQVIK